MFSCAKTRKNLNYTNIENDAIYHLWILVIGKKG